VNSGYTWSFEDAKDNLAEVLRMANEAGPQRIGAQNPCYVLSEADVLALTKPERTPGAWLVEEFAGAGELPIPDRAEAAELTARRMNTIFV
jgi:hypothetical protein